MVRLKEPEATAIVSLSGFLQRTEATKISQAVNALQGQGIKKAIFNLAEVKYANSSAIGALVNSASTLKAAGGRAVLLAMQPNLMKVFETLGLANMFTMVSTEKEAMKAIT
jgi:anti-sigma B factor antagonist